MLLGAEFIFKLRAKQHSYIYDAFLFLGLFHTKTCRNYTNFVIPCNIINSECDCAVKNHMPRCSIPLLAKSCLQRQRKTIFQLNLITSPWSLSISWRGREYVIQHHQRHLWIKITLWLLLQFDQIIKRILRNFEWKASQ